MRERLKGVTEDAIFGQGAGGGRQGVGAVWWPHHPKTVLMILKVVERMVQCPWDSGLVNSYMSSIPSFSSF